MNTKQRIFFTEEHRIFEGSIETVGEHKGSSGFEYFIGDIHQIFPEKRSLAGAVHTAGEHQLHETYEKAVSSLIFTLNQRIQLFSRSVASLERELKNINNEEEPKKNIILNKYINN